ncbi:hypothetical protein [Niallia circulans]|uniref:hypothetical protein n=1 Tax=Niallia circulans TaxID=1397 RepID=UPI00155F6DF6|nr:hypothetical protein [Niallia circulans]NRG30743.1 hypothetical protein [Niallia circulans]
MTDREPRVGDFVKYNSQDDDDITVGVYYKIIGFDWDDEPEFIDDVGERIYAADYENWDLYEKVGVEDESTALSVGDYAKITEDIYEYKVGDIVKIISKDSNLYDFRVEFVNVTGKSRCDGQTYGFIDRSFATKATDEEVANAKKEQAEAKAKAKEAERWAAIGRKPNEFKKGDVVRYIGDASVKGQLVEVFEDTRNGRTTIAWKSHRSYEPSRCIELITPVEHRFDLNGGDDE